MDDIKEMISPFNFSTKQGMIAKLQAYLSNPDDDCIRIKNLLKERMLKFPELLWALNSPVYGDQLFNKDGSLNETGEWDVYFGDSSHIRTFLFIPETQDEVMNYICYQVQTDENMRYDSAMKYLIITFTIFVHEKDSFDRDTGIARHDLIGGIIREMMAWSAITMSHATPIGSSESVTDTNYITKVLRYQAAMPNNLVVTKNNVPTLVNKDKE